MKASIVLGVGVNDADYTVIRGGKHCPFYQTWKNMLSRCYSEDYQARQPSYKGCSVCDEWLVFSNFKVWMEKQDWESRELDKDILLFGNRVYCPEYCVFLPKLVNTFMSDRRAERGKYPIGVGLHKNSGLYRARCGSLDGKRLSLGYFKTPEEAHEAWLKNKLELCRELICLISDNRVQLALLDRYENYHNYFPQEGEISC